MTVPNPLDRQGVPAYEVSAECGQCGGTNAPRARSDTGYLTDEGEPSTLSTGYLRQCWVPFTCTDVRILLEEILMTETSLDGRRARGDATRARVLQLAGDVATIDGLEGLTLTRLGKELGVSRSNVHALFGGSKLDLQLATVAAARSRFIAAVVEPQRGRPSGLAVLRGLLRSWLDYIVDDVFAGGCFVLHGLSEFGSRPGPVRDAVVQARQEWLALLEHHVEVAVTNRELDAADPGQLTFDLESALVAANVARLAGDVLGPRKARVAVEATLMRHRGPGQQSAL